MKYKVILYLGVGLVIASGLYDFAFINLPYQDPTPELIAQREQQYLVKDIILNTGITLSLIGVVIILIKKMKKKTP